MPKPKPAPDSLVEAGAAMDRVAKRAVTAIVIEVRKDQGGDSAAEGGTEASKADPWEALTGADRIILPPYDLYTLATFAEHNSELGPCIEAMEVNICGFGYRLMLPGHDEAQDAKEVDEKVLIEREELSAFLDHGAYDGASLMAIRRRLRHDLEATGNAYLEILTAADGAYVGYNHIPSHQMRLAPTDRGLTPYKEPITIGEGERRRVELKQRARRFRRFVQSHRHGKSWRQVWFKELGDPRPISADTGEVLTGADATNKAKLANPILHFKLYNPRTPYGIPRYVGNVLAILGGRAAEEINYHTFKNNNVPSMMLMVSNGKLTQGTIDRIQEYVQNNVKGKDNYSKFLILEADPDGDDGGQVKIEVKPMTDSQRDDAMFQKYEANNANKVRRSFRLPPIFVGAIEGYDRGTAETSRRFGDEQVFAPERDEEDHAWNRLLRMAGMVHHFFKTNSPNVTDDEDIIKVMAAAERSGAMTPRRATALLEDILGRKVFPLDGSVNPDLPFSQAMAAAVQNKAKPNEVGQQVTALKAKFIRELVTKERAMGAAALPAVRVAASEAVNIAAGVSDSILTSEASDDTPGMFVLCDATHAIAMVELGERESILKDGATTYSYPIIQVTSFEPSPYISILDSGGTFVEGMALQ
jgi:PBSX family phage portal protein